MDLQDLSTLYTCFIVGGFVIPVINVAVGALGGAFHLGDVDIDTDVDVDLDADVDVDIDADLDVDTDLDLSTDAAIDGAVHALGASHNPIPVNLMTLSFSAVVFGAVGRLVLERMSVPLGLIISVLCGLTAGALLGRFVILPLKRNRANATNFRRLRGTEGVVKLEIREDFVGTIAIPSATGSLVTYSARPAPGFHTLPIGQKVIIVGVETDREVCIVQPLCDMREQPTTLQI
ncbi:MAG: hypothetical protein EOM52_09205 [Clostridia bacterium]|nr:hypothetical protein [Clostridia bacterium]